VTALIRAEIRKLFTTKLWLWMFIATVGLTALFVSLTIAFDGQQGNEAPRLNTPEGQRNLFGSPAGAAVIVGILGIIAMTSEFRHMTATPTFLATPRRGRVVTAKMITYTGLGIAYAAAAVGVTLAVALPWLAAKNIDVSLGANGIPQTLIGVGANVAIYAVLGVGLGALLKNQIAAVVGLLVYLLVVGPVLTAITSIRDYTKFLPDAAAMALVQSTPAAGSAFLEQWQGGAVLIGWALLFAVLGYVFTVRRDIT
jgi:ABC-type transport system involved in multi-copper enzyme maturation permease subunit